MRPYPKASTRAGQKSRRNRKLPAAALYILSFDVVKTAKRLVCWFSDHLLL